MTNYIANIDTKKYEDLRGEKLYPLKYKDKELVKARAETWKLNHFRSGGEGELDRLYVESLGFSIIARLLACLSVSKETRAVKQAYAEDSRAYAYGLYRLAWLQADTRTKRDYSTEAWKVVDKCLEFICKKAPSSDIQDKYIQVCLLWVSNMTECARS